MNKLTMKRVVATARSLAFGGHRLAAETVVERLHNVMCGVADVALAGAPMPRGWAEVHDFVALCPMTREEIKVAHDRFEAVMEFAEQIGALEASLEE